MQLEKRLNQSPNPQGVKRSTSITAGTAARLPCQAGKTIAPLKGKGRSAAHTPPAETSSKAPPAIRNDTQRVCIWHTVMERVSVTH